MRSSLTHWLPSVHEPGVVVGLVAAAARESRACGCEWLNVDFEEHPRAFYFDNCGFRPTDAGLIPL